MEHPWNVQPAREIAAAVAKLNKPKAPHFVEFLYHQFGWEALPPANVVEFPTATEGTQMFNFDGANVRVVERDGEAWFVLVDVCKVLEIGNVARTKDRIHGDDLRTTQVIDRLGRSQAVSVVNRVGLFDVLLDSRKPEAKKFRRWVVSEVLPAIEDHGGYLTETKLEEALLNPDTLIQLATNLKEEQQARKALELEKAENEPKVRLAEAVGESSRNVTLTAMSKILRNVGVQMNRNEFCQWLRI